MADFGLPDKTNPGANVQFSRDRFDEANRQWAEANDHTYVNSTDYTNLHWTLGINRPSDIYNSSNVSLPATTDVGLQILNRANVWSSKNGFNLRVNGMARSQAVQDFIRQQPRMMGVAATQSSHKVGGIDLDYPRKRDGSIDSAKTDEFKKYLKSFGYKVVDHNNHIHVSPPVGNI